MSVNVSLGIRLDQGHFEAERPKVIERLQHSFMLNFRRNDVALSKLFAFWNQSKDSEIVGFCRATREYDIGCVDLNRRSNLCSRSIDR